MWTAATSLNTPRTAARSSVVETPDVGGTCVSLICERSNASAIESDFFRLQRGIGAGGIGSRAAIGCGCGPVGLGVGAGVGVRVAAGGGVITMVSSCLSGFLVGATTTAGSGACAARLRDPGSGA